MNNLFDLFPIFGFDDNKDLFHDASQDLSSS